jgi:hypothetical protein
MKPLGFKTVYSILAGSLLAVSLILGVEGRLNLLHFFVGFALCAPAAFVALYLRTPILLAGAAFVLVLGSYGAIRAGWQDAAYGAILAMGLLSMLHHGWIVGGHPGAPGYADYVREQKERQKREGDSGPMVDYSERQKLAYEKEKAKAAGESGRPAQRPEA